MKMPFGKFKGRRICKIESWYLRWLVANVTGRDEVVAEAKRVLETRDEAPTKRGAKCDTDHEMEAERFKAMYEEASATIYDLQLELDMLRHDGVGRADTSWWADWWRRAVKVAHPDRGGSERLMAMLNEANERMRQS